MQMNQGREAHMGARKPCSASGCTLRSPGRDGKEFHALGADIETIVKATVLDFEAVEVL